MSEYYRHPVILEMLATVGEVLRALDIDFFIVGALARDIRLSADPQLAAKRATRDVDIAIMVGSQQEFEQVKEAMVKTGRFAADDAIAIKLIYKQRIEVDLLPFGGIEDDLGLVRIDHPKPFLLDVPGFQEVLSTVSEYMIESVAIRVCSLEGIVLLKLFANADNPSRTKDITDIEHIILVYFELEIDKIFVDFADVPEMYSTTAPNYLSLVSARVIGRVMARLLAVRPSLRQRLLNILLAKAPNRYWPEMAAGVEESIELK